METAFFPPHKPLSLEILCGRKSWRPCLPLKATLKISTNQPIPEEGKWVPFMLVPLYTVAEQSVHAPALLIQKN